jgi:hypothetical protein
LRRRRFWLVIAELFVDDPPVWRLSVEHRNTVAPRVDDVLDALAHLFPSRFAVDSRHEQSVVVGVDMAHGGDDGQAYSVAVQGPPRGASPDTAAAACRRVKRNHLGAVDRTTGELLTDGGGELATEEHVLIGPAALLACPATGTQIGVGQTLLCSLFIAAGSARMP